MQIHVLKAQGLSLREIARRLGVSRNTVTRYLADAEVPRYKTRSPRPTKLEPFHDYIRQRMDAATPDWIADPTYAFTATLGFSRWRWVMFTRDERAATLVRCHHALFEALGGVPKEILYDNAKTIVITRDAYGDGLHDWHSDLLDLAKRYNFVPRLCRPYRAQTKGKVERFRRYLCGNFYVPLSSLLKQSGLVLDVNTANAEVGKWLRDVANQRIHALTGMPPAELFEQRERDCLQPLPAFARPMQTTMRRWSMADMEVPMQHPLSVYQRLLTEVRV